MSKKLTCIYFALITIFALSGCAAFRQADRKELLRAELAKWENFTSDGVVQANYAGLSLRKMFTLSKTKEEARLDVLGGGVFGVNPQPLVSVYLGEYVALRSPLMPELESFAQSAIPEGLSLKLLSDPDSLVAAYGDEIAGTGKLIRDKVELTFSDNMRLTKLTDSESGASIVIDYTGKGDPDKVKLDLGEGVEVDLLIDKTTYGNAEVVPLPLPEPLLELEETLQGIIEGESSHD